MSYIDQSWHWYWIFSHLFTLLPCRKYKSIFFSWCWLTRPRKLWTQLWPEFQWRHRRPIQTRDWRKVVNATAAAAATIEGRSDVAIRHGATPTATSRRSGSSTTPTSQNGKLLTNFSGRRKRSLASTGFQKSNESSFFNLFQHFFYQRHDIIVFVFFDVSVSSGFTSIGAGGPWGTLSLQKFGVRICYLNQMVRWECIGIRCAYGDRTLFLASFASLVGLNWAKLSRCCVTFS